MIKYYKGQHIIHLTDAVLEQHRKQSSKKRILVDPGKLKWKPYVLVCTHSYAGARTNDQTRVQSSSIGFRFLVSSLPLPAPLGAKLIFLVSS